MALLGVLAGARRCPASVPLLSRTTHDQWNAVAAAHPSGDVIAAGMSLPPWVGREQPPCSFVAARLARDSGAVLWRYVEDDCESDETISEEAGERVFVDPAGDVLVGRTDHGAGPWFGVYKLAGATGEMIWAHDIGGFHSYGPLIQAMITDSAGDVVAGGGFHRARPEPYLDPNNTELVVVKLDSATGQELWRRTLVGDFVGDDEDRGLNQVQGLAVDDARDVFVSGVIFNRQPGSRSPDVRWFVQKLCGVNGEELWRHDVGSGRALLVDRTASSIAVDAQGDLLVAGHGVIVKLAGTSGVERWRRDFPDLGTTTWPDLGGTTVRIAPDDDLIVAGVATTGELEGDILIIRLRGDDGAERWRRQIDGSADDEMLALYGGVADIPYDVTIVPDGSVLVAGQLANLGSDGDALVLALEGATGHERWRREIDGEAHAGDAAFGLALVDLEHVVSVGAAAKVETGTDALADVLSIVDGKPQWRRECDGLDRAGELPENACVLASAPTTTNIVTTTTTSTTIRSCLFVSCEDGDPCTSDRCDGVTCRHAPATGSDAARCMLAGGTVGVRDCRGGATPARLARQLARARRLLERAERAMLPIRRQRLMGSAVKQLNRAGRIAVRRGCTLTGKPRAGT